MTKRTMMETAFYGQNQSSFEDASVMINKALCLKINKETIREITESIGSQIHENDVCRAKATTENMEKIEIAKKAKKTTLYIMMDGVAVNTSVEDENGSTWRENKTVMVFTDKDMIRRKDGGNIIVRKEYMAFIGNTEMFKSFVFDAAVRAGYGLDLFHLKENIYTYAKYKYNQDAKQYTPCAESIIAKI